MLKLYVRRSVISGEAPFWLYTDILNRLTGKTLSGSWTEDELYRLKLLNVWVRRVEVHLSADERWEIWAVPRDQQGLRPSGFISQIGSGPSFE